MPVVKPRTSSLKHTVTLTVGDWSQDGHNQVKTVEIRTNLTKAGVVQAHRRGLKKLQIVSFEDSVARDFEDAELPNWVALRLKAAGYDVDKRVERHWERPDAYMLSVESYVGIWMFIAKLGAPRMVHKLVERKENINIGGYGLFLN